MINKKIAIIGAGNLGYSMAKGLKNTDITDSRNILLSDISVERRERAAHEGFKTADNNKEAVSQSQLIILAVKPYHVTEVIEEIKGSLDANTHVLISCAPGIDSNHIYGTLEKTMPLFRVMPNTAMGVNETAACITAFNAADEIQNEIKELFSALGMVYEINEELMHAATAIGGCGTAFVLRFMRALSEGAIEMGFSPELALQIVAQTVKGAAAIIQQNGTHPEEEIDKVTTPAGITITGLNEMEHQGFSSAVIAGIMESFEKLNG